MGERRRSWVRSYRPGAHGILLRQWNDLRREPLHFLVLRAELEQQQLDPGLLELLDALRDLLGRPHQTRLQPAVRDRVVLEADALLRSEEHTSELQSRLHLVCRLLLEKKK